MLFEVTAVLINLIIIQCKLPDSMLRHHYVQVFSIS